MPPMKVPMPSVRSPRVSAAWSTLRPVISPRARNMPADSIITTTMTMLMVTMATRSNFGIPKAKGMTTSNQGAAATLAKPIRPIPQATAQPATMPTRTETLARKPRAYLVTSRISTSTPPAMPRCSGSP